MFFAILRFEFKYWLKHIAFYVYAALFFLFALLTMAGAAGMFGEGSSGLEVANSPFHIFTFALFVGKLLLLLVPAIVGETIFRDYKSNIHSILYAYPITKRAYLPAKFLGGTGIVLLIGGAMLLGLLLGACLPGADAAKTIPPDPGVYVQVFLLYLVPNVLVVGALVFALVAIGRNIYAGFMSVLILLLLREAVIRLTGGPDPGLASLLVDPFGETPTHQVTRHWSAADRNTLPIPLDPALVFNRLVWLACAAAVCGYLYRRFSFEQHNPAAHAPPGRNQTPEQHPVRQQYVPNPPPKITPDFSAGPQIRALWRLAWSDFRFVRSSGAFGSILAAGALFIAVLLLNTNAQSGTRLLPASWVVLGLPMIFFSLLVQGLTFLYAGVLVHRARAARFHAIADATPMPDRVLFGSKFLALVFMQILLLMLVLAVGLAVQVYEGYFDFGIGHYLFDLFVVHLPGFVVWALAALLVQTLFTNPYLGLFVLVLGVLGLENLPALGIKSAVLQFNQSPEPDFFLRYSDMNGHNHGLRAHLLYQAYWLVWAVLLGGAGLLFWPRGIARSFPERLCLARARATGRTARLLAVGCLSAGLFGFWLYREAQQPLNRAPGDETALLDRYEKTFGKYRDCPQPRIVSVSLRLDLYPEDRSFRASGHYMLVNKTGRPLDTLLLRTGFDEITALDIPAGASPIEADSLLNCVVFKLEKPLGGGDSLLLNFRIRNRTNTLFARNSNVLANGAHLKSDLLPMLGFDSGGAGDRSGTRLRHYQRADSDRVALEIIVGTEPAQTAIAPGYLLREWRAQDRRFFHYKTDHDIKLVFSVLSGRYDVFQENYRGVDLRIYHHPAHTHNLPQMLAGLKAALDYHTEYFGPYQHRQVQIIEFPRSEGTYATTAANGIPISEVRFLNDGRSASTGGIDLAFYVAAHELAHQWWGNQLIPADAPGAAMLTESIAEYATARVYEKHYGKESARRFLNIQRERYRVGRADETGEEMPLVRVGPKQSYIAYGKGALAFYRLSEHVGEVTLNAALRQFLEENRFQGPPYPTAPDLIEHLKRAAPDSVRHLVRDWFETVGAVDAEK
ncbi:MAG: hypothetical protein JNJ90_19995 [Saprospiraceae bacterium]|jgi:ABC-2 type transport system permease protein|nr:hypothetical protein [Saprospiraceae bacterium]